MLSPRQTTSSDIISIQYLRAVAALLIVYQHAREFVPEHFARLKFFNGECGIDIFFVISGFIMTVTAAGAAPRDFLLRRLTRIVPLYWFFSVLAVALFFVARPWAGNIEVTVQTLVMSLLFIPHENLTHPGKIWPILPQGWTLMYEMFFYITFALLLSLPVHKRIIAIGLGYLGLVGLGVLLPHTNIPLVYVLTNPILLEFVSGMVVGHLYLRRRELPFLMGAALLVTGTGWLVVECFSEAPRLSVRGVTAFMIVLGAVSMESQRGMLKIGFLRLLGDSSYSIYLSHLFVLQMFTAAWSAAGFSHSGNTSALAYAACSMAFSAWVGGLVYRSIERPMLRASRKLCGPNRDEFANPG